MAQGNFEPRTGHPVNDPEPLVRWLDLIQQYMNRFLFVSGSYLAILFQGTEQIKISTSGAQVGTRGSAIPLILEAADGANEGGEIQYKGAASYANWTLDCYQNNFRVLTNGAGYFNIQAPTLMPAGTTTIAPLNIPHGSAPTSPVNGDIWTTTAGLYVRINGATVGPLS